MIKIIVPTITKEVGTTAALLLQHINYWMITQQVSKVFRTNNELVEDLNNMFTVFQIQYAKKKLVDNGYLILSFDKGTTRTTHYTFTEKALDLLKEHTEYLLNKIRKKTSRKTHVESFYRDNTGIGGTTVPEQQNISTNASGEVLEAYEDFDMKSPKQPNTKKKLSSPVQMTNKGMQEAFAEYGSKRCNVKKDGVPDSLKHLIKNKGEDMKKHVDISPINEDTCSIDVLNVFHRIPNINVFENNRKVKEQMYSFKEDW